MSKLSDTLASALTSGAECGISTSLPHIDIVTDGVTSVLCSTLDTVAPMKKRIRKQKRLAPGYIDQTHELKQIT